MAVPSFAKTVWLMTVLLSITSARESCPASAPLQDRVRRTPVVFHGLAVRADTPPQGLQYSAQFWLIKVYKGSQSLAQFFHLDPHQQDSLDIRDRRVNVTGFLRPEGNATSDCWPSLAAQKYYIVLAAVVGKHLVAKEDTSGALIDWSATTEKDVWNGVGWSEWTDWTACSASCGEGSQHRLRHCLQGGCEGCNKQSRRCNMFSCQGVVSPLLMDQKRYLHGQWGRSPDRQTAWRLRPSAYLWLPAAELPTSVHHLRKHFAVLITVRLNPKEPAAGTLFSLRSRRQQNSYLSVELAGKEVVKLVHSGPNGTQTVMIPASLADGHWHQLAIGVQQDSSVRSYLDCEWISTDILRRGSLDIPEDADVIIGYLFSGDLEQLVLVADPAAVSQQCSPSLQSISDPYPAGDQQQRRRTEPKDVWYSKEDNEIWQDDDEDMSEGSGSDSSLEKYEYAWSEWSKCSVTCGLGVQTRHVSCSDSGSWLSFCLETNQGKSESRPCNAIPCSSSDQLSNLTGSVDKDLCECLNGGTCHLKRRTCHCPAGFGGRHCEIRECPGPCLHGGICHNSGHCSCPPEYTGETCQTPVCRPPCMNGGQCVKPGVCSCPSNSNHPRCATAVCPGGCEPGGACVSPGVCRCVPGFHGSLCQDSLCPQGCYNGGQCVTANQCNCTAGWTGTDCTIPVCEPPCQRGGRCVGPQTCLCPSATHGPSCQNYTCTRGCYNGGVCVGPDLCECPVNATGPTCSQPLCDPPCENGAACGPGNTCLCGPHTTGTRCQTRNCDYRFVQEPYTRGFRKLVKKRVETKCGVKTCFRTLAEYHTVYKTFYRTVYKCAGD
ncbi:uncharacterized protein LOC124353141 isoform X2 [Homalodisca vitripennis]|uniref:uncharacterized protein LOC124353141 isoform X2 n=1 Tax=Homalodisca vitripennis TaxID=197043 RepID=UPI001EECE51E|nr:uncharacterized protein LOC124353141 isoform X2 [Homalodisca vitripennis]